jgi:anti-anti-sigma factor
MSIPVSSQSDSLGERLNARPPSFVCSCTGDLEAAWVHMAGELDIATAPQLERTLREPRLQARVVVIDMRELAFIDSSGVHAIVTASTRARKVGHRLVLLRGAPNVDRMFALTGSSLQVEIDDGDPLEPRVQALRRFARAEVAP